MNGDQRSILAEALDTSMERGREYGPPDENFEATARLWDAYLTGVGRPLGGVDYALMMVLAKIARIQTGGPDREHFLDIAGYARAAAEVAGYERLNYDHDEEWAADEAATMTDEEVLVHFRGTEDGRTRDLLAEEVADRFERAMEEDDD